MAGSKDKPGGEGVVEENRDAKANICDLSLSTR